MTITSAGESSNDFDPIPFAVPSYYTISTTAVIEGTIEICVNYDDTGLDPGDEEKLSLYQNNGSGWLEIGNILNVENNMVCGVTSSLSTYAVGIPTGICGDLDKDGVFNILDIVHYIDFFFKDYGLIIDPAVANVDCNSYVNILDIITMIIRIFHDGPELECCDVGSSWPENYVHLIQWEEQYGGNGHWYAIIPKIMFWVEAEAFAASLELEEYGYGYLATVTSLEENDFIFNFVINGQQAIAFNDEYWLGGKDDGGWQWISGEEWLFENWAPYEPNNGGFEKALAMWGPTNTDYRKAPGTWNNSLIDDRINNINRLWSIIEWGLPR
jgi:hypothetical protein